MYEEDIEVLWWIYTEFVLYNDLNLLVTITKDSEVS